MTHAIGLRATSFVASATLLGFAVLAGLTMTIVQRIEMLPEGLEFVTYVEPPPPPPVEPVRTSPPEAPPLVPSESFAPVMPPVEPQATQIASSGPPTFYPVPTIVNPQWVRRPSNLARYYPERALQREVEGRVVLDCGVSVAGALNCAVVSESPANWGFGAAALRISNDYQMVPAMRDGVVVEARHRMVVPFEIR
ncbi:MAG: TonB family protein [Vitreimonas sp.]